MKNETKAVRSLTKSIKSVMGITSHQMEEVMPMTDFTELVKLLTAMVSLLTALVGLSKALKQGSKPKKKGHRR